MLLFGGQNTTVARADTWEWDGTSWTERSPTVGPPARSAHAMAVDVDRDRVVLFGGVGVGFQHLADTWEWDGNNWVQQSPQHSPTQRREHAMAYDSARRRTVLFGGQDPAGLLADTWEWDGTDWLQRSPGTTPGARSGHAMAFDSARERLVLFGSRSLRADTWEYGSTRPASVRAFGSGCTGSAGVPSLSADGGRRPWLGDTLMLRLDHIPATSQAYLFLGLSRTAWGPFPLPFDLTPVGLTGCALHVSGDFLFPLAPAGGVALLPIPVPNDPNLLGGVFYDQAFAVDPPANPFGATVSNAIEARIGGR